MSNIDEERPRMKDDATPLPASPSGRPPAEPAPTSRAPKVARTPAIIATLIIAGIVGLSLWYLVQPQPLIIQGEADATRLDIAARVDGRVAQRPVSRGENV